MTECLVDDEIKVWVRYNKNTRSYVNNLEQMKILTPNGDRVPLSEIATYEVKRGDVSINHLDGKREIQINANLIDPNISAADIVFDLRNNKTTNTDCIPLDLKNDIARATGNLFV